MNMDNRLEQIMKEKGLTQKQLGEILNMNQSNISRIINGKDINLSTAKRISKTLGYSIEYIWPG